MPEWFHTAVLIIHVLGAAIIFGVVVVSFLIQHKKPQAPENLKLLGQFAPVMQKIFGLEILTGIFLAGSEWEEFSKNPLLWIKLGIIVAVSAVGFVIANRNKKAMEQSKPVSSPDPRIAWLMLLAYLAIISIGVLLAESAG